MGWKNRWELKESYSVRQELSKSGTLGQRARLYVEESRKKLGLICSCKSSCTTYFNFFFYLWASISQSVLFCSHEVEGCKGRGVTQARSVWLKCVHVGRAQMCVLCRKVIECIQNLSGWKWIKTLDSFAFCNLAFSGLKLPEKLPHPWFPKPSLTSWDTRTYLQKTWWAVTVLQALKVP